MIMFVSALVALGVAGCDRNLGSSFNNRDNSATSSTGTSGSGDVIANLYSEYGGTGSDRAAFSAHCRGIARGDNTPPVTGAMAKFFQREGVRRSCESLPAKTVNGITDNNGNSIHGASAPDAANSANGANGTVRPNSINGAGGADDTPH
jgi:hypothetical protein